MKITISLVSLLFVVSTMATDLKRQISRAEDEDDVRLIFAFELVRHGARAPIEEREIDKFSVAAGMLTPSGMRQRFLLGQWNRHRYTQTYKLLSEEYDPNQIYIQSTNVNRTMQSGYSELMGLYPPGSGDQLTQAQIKALSDVSAPPFKIRSANQINEQLNADALPGRPVAVPISVYNNNNIQDDVSTDGCPYINMVEKSRIDDDATYADYTQMVEDTREPLQSMYDLTDEYIDQLNYHFYERLTDTAVALEFEGQIKHEAYFTDE